MTSQPPLDRIRRALSPLASSGVIKATGETKISCPHPTHKDTDPSASWNADKLAWHCQGCGESGGWKDLLKCVGDWEEEKRKPNNGSPYNQAKRKEIPSEVGKVDLITLSKWMKIPQLWLEEQGLYMGKHQLKNEKNEWLEYSGVVFPCYSLDGSSEISRPIRLAVKSKMYKYRYLKNGGGAVPYGLERLKSYRATRGRPMLIITEGQTCRLALSYHGIPALGMLGAKTWKSLEIEHIRGFKWIYLTCEGGDEESRKAAKIFVEGMAGRIAELKWSGVLSVISPGLRDSKDWLELHREIGEDTEVFKNAVKDAIKSAKPIDAKKSSPVNSIFVCLADVEEKKVDWRFQPYVPCGSRFTILGGPEGTGKGWMWSDMASRVTMGEDLFGVKICEPMRVIVISPEDDPSRQLKKKFRQGGADQSLVMVCNSPSIGLDQGSIDLIKRALESMKNPEAGLLIVDPFFRMVGNNADTNKASAVYAFIEPLTLMLNEYPNLATILVTHTNKSQHVKIALQRISGAGLTAAAGSVLLIEQDTKNSTRGYSPGVFSHAKTNLGEGIGPSIGWTITDDGFVWGDTIPLSADVLGESQAGSIAHRTYIKSLKDALQAFLSKNSGEELMKNVKGWLRGQGFSANEVVLAEACEAAGIKARIDEKSNDVFWALDGIEPQEIMDSEIAW